METTSKVRTQLPCSPCRFPSPKGVGTCPVNTVRTRRAPLLNGRSFRSRGFMRFVRTLRRHLLRLAKVLALSGPNASAWSRTCLLCAPSGGCVSTLGVGLGFSVDLDSLTTTITANVVYTRSMVSLGMRSLCDRRPLVNRNKSMARLPSLTLSGNLFGSSFLLLSGLMLIASSVKLTPLVNLGILFIGAQAPTAGNAPKGPSRAKKLKLWKRWRTLAAQEASAFCKKARLHRLGRSAEETSRLRKQSAATLVDADTFRAQRNDQAVPGREVSPDSIWWKCNVPGCSFS